MSRELTEADVPQNVRQMIRDYCRNSVTAGQCAANVYNALRLVDAPPSERVPEVTSDMIDLVRRDLNAQPLTPYGQELFTGIMRALEYCAAQNRRPDAR